MSDAFLIKKPWVTEKSTEQNVVGQYAFIVKPHATKPEIKKMVSTLYKVDVTSVNILNRPAKQKRFGTAIKGKRGAYRKAIVTLKKGQKIDIQ